MFGGTDRFAHYESGNTSNTLLFHFTVVPTDVMITFDYFSRFSLLLTSCAGDSTGSINSVAGLSTADIVNLNYIRRYSPANDISADITLPPINYKETVISPSSITGGGKYISLTNNLVSVPRKVSSTAEAGRDYTVGDYIDVSVEFSAPVTVIDTVPLPQNALPTEPDAAVATLPYFMFADLEEHGCYMEYQSAPNVITFRYAVQPNETSSLFTYLDEFAMRISILGNLLVGENTVLPDGVSGDNLVTYYAAQNVPAPQSATSYAMDLVSSQNIRIATREEAKIIGVAFEFRNGWQAVSLDFIAASTRDIEYIPPSGIDISTFVGNNYNIGDVVKFVVEFSHAVSVIGRPFVSLNINGVMTNVFYDSKYNDTALLFTMPLESVVPTGVSYPPVSDIICSRQSKFVVGESGSRVVMTSSFVSVVDANIDLKDLCCTENCFMRTTVSDVTPTIVSVYSTQTGSFSVSDVVSINVQFSGPIDVMGTPLLLLDLYSTFMVTEIIPNAVVNFTTVTSPTNAAVYFGKFDESTLCFKYIVKSFDFSSMLSYVDTNSLVLRNPSLDKIFMSDTSMYSISNVNDTVESKNTFPIVIDAVLTLPAPGSSQELGRTSEILINADRLRIISVEAGSLAATSGEFVYISILYSEPMNVLLNNEVLTVGNDGLEGIQLNLILVIAGDVNTGAGLVTAARQASMSSLSEDGLTATFRIRIVPTDPSSDIIVDPISSLSFSTVNVLLTQHTYEMKAIATAAPSPVSLTASLINQIMSTIDNEIPAVVIVNSPNLHTVYPYGVGDIIDIYVDMSIPVAVILTDEDGAAQEHPRLELQFTDGSLYNATYISDETTDEDGNTILAPFTSSIHFQYTVALGKNAAPLDFSNSGAFTGDIRRYSFPDSLLPADLTLPNPIDAGSLGFCCNLIIDAAVPYIESLIPVKKHGVYGEGEPIMIIARFNRPVIVSGFPYLLLKTGVLSTGAASYTAINKYPDVMVQVSDNDVIFEYIVQFSDNIASLVHAGSDAFKLNSSQILLKTMNHSAEADVTVLLLSTALDQLDAAL